MTTEDKWNRIYRTRLAQSDAAEACEAPAPEPATVLIEFAHLLPVRGRGLDLACGLGENATFLAERGFTTDAIDISGVAIEHLTTVAAARNLPIRAYRRDLEALDLTTIATSGAPKEMGYYDVIVVAHYLDRTLCARLEALLKPRGLLFYQTFTRLKTAAIGPTNPDYLLEENELLKLFPSLRLRAYREEALAGDLDDGLRNQAYLVGQRPAE